MKTHLLLKKKTFKELFNLIAGHQKINKTALLVFLIMMSMNLMSFGQSTTCVPPAANGTDDPWSEECYLNSTCGIQGDPCTANDVNLHGIFMADADGNPIPTCTFGDSVTAYLWATFINGTGSDRYAVRTRTEVWIDGVYYTEVNKCSFDIMSPGEASDRLLGPFRFQCGQTIQLLNSWIAWDVNPAQCSDPFGSNYDWKCVEYPPSKCFKDLNLNTFLTTNYSHTCGTVTSTTTEICFTDLTIGGTPPYTYLWSFGDGGTSTLKNPCHTYNSISGSYTVTLNVTDQNGTGVTTSAQEVINLSDCHPPLIPIANWAIVLAVGMIALITFWKFRGK